MFQTVFLVLSAQIRRAFQTIVEVRRRAVTQVLRARIVLLSDKRLPVLEVARQAGVSRPMVWRWQQRFAEDGLECRLRDKTRLPGKDSDTTGGGASCGFRSKPATDSEMKPATLIRQ